MAQPCAEAERINDRLEGGLLALRSNIASHERDELAFVPEVGLNIGLQLTRRLKARSVTRFSGSVELRVPASRSTPS
jgi:Putative beta barrel porin-7 (BBP7)